MTRMLSQLVWLASLVIPTTGVSAADGADVVVTRGTAVVTLADVDAYVESIPVEQRSPFVADGERVERMLDNLLMAEQLADEQRATEKVKGVDPLLAARLRFVENEARAQYFVARMRGDAPAVDAAALARERYTAAPENFIGPALFDLRHVLVKTTGRSEAAAAELIERIRAEAVADPDQFPELAERYSEDKSTSMNGGLMTGVAIAKLDAAFGAALQGLASPGDISPMVRTQFGLHVIQLLSKRPGRQLDFAEVRSDLEAQVAREAADRWVEKRIVDLRNTPSEANEAVANSIRQRYDSPDASSPKQQ
ncbi:MAG: peptidylprolyl isomerase [Xanthomonadales bacterium]|nr:peptidylprolyl isomerase [Xanthomonadales bacterium]MBP7418228.1 peptidylprolyl isomerase [Xanthomonadales bacterium]MBP7624022.1 peptidylprolyl isomerase [Xanthomonadales bacterium]